MIPSFLVEAAPFRERSKPTCGLTVSLSLEALTTFDDFGFLTGEVPVCLK